MTNSGPPEREARSDGERRRAFIKQWAEYVRTHDDTEWSRQQKTIIDAQLQSANELARRGDTDPIDLLERLDERRRDKQS